MTERERELEAENERLRSRVEALEGENRLLRQKVDLLIRQVFGSKSEQLDPGQLELLLGQSPEPEPEPKKAEAPAISLLDEGSGDETGAGRKPRQPRATRMRLPEDLPVEEVVLEPEPVKACPEAWRRIGEEVSEELDYEPGRFWRRRTVRPKYVRRADSEAAPIVAALPDKLLERGMLAPGLLAHITISKYADHLPLYRQEHIYQQRHGVKLTRQTMANGVALVADWLKPIVTAMAKEQFTEGYVQVDESPVRYLEPGRGKAAQGYLWVVHEPGEDTVYHWFNRRSQACLESIVPADFQGVLQCDAYSAYESYASKRDGIELAGCWAHARRKFHEALIQGEAPTRNAWVLRLIGKLYGIERELRESRAGPRLREARRQSHSRPILDRIHRALERFEQSRRHLPSSLTGKAIAYALRQWPMLVAYLEDGRIEIDNNLVENAIRPTAVGKKNWLFFGAEEAGWRSAVIYSIITSCRQRGIDPYAYLKEVLTRLPTMTNRQIHTLTPRAWAEERKRRVIEANPLAS